MMGEFEFYIAQTPPELALQVSIVLGVVWILLHLLGWVGTFLWDWVDDRSPTGQNKFGEFIFGFIKKGWNRGERNSSNFYRPGVRSDRDRWSTPSSDYYDCGEAGCTTILGIGLPLCTTPFIVLFIYTFPWIATSIGSFVLLMLLARLSRRTQKVVKKHIEDKDSHIINND